MEKEVDYMVSIATEGEWVRYEDVLELERECMALRVSLESQWISVEERMPSPGDPVVWLIPLRGGIHYEAGFLTNDGKTLDWDGDYFGYDRDAVTHWMPLPDRPDKGEG